MIEKRNFHLHNGRNGSALAVRVVPRSSKNEIAEIMDDGTVKIRVKASPVEGQANAELIEFLSDLLDVPKSNVEIIAGLTGKDKLISIINMDAVVAQKRIMEFLES